MKRIALALSLLAFPAAAQAPDHEKAALGAEILQCTRDKISLRIDAAKEIEALRARIAELEKPK